MNTSSFTTSLLDAIKDIHKKVQLSNDDEYPPAHPLQKWNDSIELEFLETASKRGNASTVIRKVPDDIDGSSCGCDNNGRRTSTTERNENVVVATVEEVSIGIHALIIRFVASSYGIPEMNLATSTSTEKENKGTATFETSCAAKDISKFSFQTNNDANEATMSIIQSMKEIPSRGKTTGRDLNSQSDEALDLLSQLIRASKNLIRWNRILLGRAKAKRKSKESKCQISGLDACYRLCSPEMVNFYLTLLEINSIPCCNNVEIPMIISQKRDDLAKHSCVALFHSTYGEAREPICKKSLGEFTSPSSKIYSIQRIMKLLVSSSSMQVTLALIKLIHNLVGSVSGILSVIDLELKTLMQSEKEMEEKTLPESSVETNLISILVSTLAWSIRSLPPFPGNNHLLDKRSEIAIEIVRVLFAMQHKHHSSYKKVNDSYPEVMTQLGVLIVDILHLPNRDKRVYECKVSVLMLLMDAPKEFSQFLQINYCVEPLLTILWLQLNEIIIEKEGMVQGQSSAASILPILILLNKLSQANKSIKAQIKAATFPPERDDEIMAKSMSQNDGKAQTTSASLPSSSTKSNNMNPVDAPRGTLRWKLIQLMTWTESNVKRCASELLWTLCNGDSKEFVARTGFGNAVHMLGIRGLVNIPK